MRPGQQSPRKREGGGPDRLDQGPRFNEAGATIAPETLTADGYAIRTIAKLQ